jgi:hypothetical protein
MVRLHSTISALVPLSVSFAYQWPNPALDALESLRWDQSGFKTGLLGLQKTPCREGIPSNAADWLRTVYSTFRSMMYLYSIVHDQGFHDTATHNAAAGTGGLDASIQFPEELQRPEVSELLQPSTHAQHKSIEYRRQLHRDFEGCQQTDQPIRIS